MPRKMQAAILAVFWGEFVFISSSILVFKFFKTGNPASCSGLPVSKCVKLIRYSVFADRAAIADVLNPFTISQIAKTSSCKPIGMCK